MKILHIVPSYVPAYRYGGPIESVHALNRALVEAGAEVEVFTTNKDGDKALRVPTDSPIAIDGVRVRYFPISFPRAWCYSREMARALSKRVAEFDVVHITSVFLAQSTLGARYAKRLGKPYVISPRGSLMLDPLKRKRLKKKIYLYLLEKKNIAGASLVHFTTRGEEEGYPKNFPRVRSCVIPNVVPALKEAPAGFSLRNELGLSGDAKIILFAGRLHPIKGFDVLLPAFADVAAKFPEARLLIAGEDENGYKKEIERMAKQLSVDGKIIFAGMLVDGKKTSAFLSADVLALTSYSENFGMAVGEAMSAGIPVVVTDSVGISGAVKETESGKVIPREPKACAEAISEILGNPALAKRLGENGIKAVDEIFSPKSVAQRMLREYNEIIKK